MIAQDQLKEKGEMRKKAQADIPSEEHKGGTKQSRLMLSLVQGQLSPFPTTKD